eukprot:TRINITY_DN13438_c0_g1_i2.p1 TRINITY_DN13438_c0_g1~~TRINITY_DN13438_c0_g1_i2.p1  ORF type:complete len:1098 (+),score=294.67 TRINITY_DN13438_c0_g1_i2:68-3361(+)
MPQSAAAALRQDPPTPQGLGRPPAGHAGTCCSCHFDKVLEALTEPAAAVQIFAEHPEELRRRIAQEVDSDGRSLLHHAAAAGAGALVQPLADAGADLDLRCAARGEPPLHAALRRQRLVTAQRLIDAGVDCGARDAVGRTALHVAVQHLADGQAEEALVRALARSGPLHALAECCGAGGGLLSAVDVARRRHTSMLWESTRAECAIWPAPPADDHRSAAAASLAASMREAGDEGAEDCDSDDSEEDAERDADSDKVPFRVRALLRVLLPFQEELWAEGGQHIDQARLRVLLCEMGSGAGEGQISESDLKALRRGLEAGVVAEGGVIPGGSEGSGLRLRGRRLPVLSGPCEPESYPEAQRMLTEAVMRDGVWELSDFARGAGVCFLFADTLWPQVAELSAQLHCAPEAAESDSPPPKVFCMMRPAPRGRLDAVVCLGRRPIAISGPCSMMSDALKMRGAVLLDAAEGLECALACGPEAVSLVFALAGSRRGSSRACPADIYASARRQWGRCRRGDPMQSHPLLPLACLRGAQRLVQWVAPLSRKWVVCQALSVCAGTARVPVFLSLLTAHPALCLADAFAAAQAEERRAAGEAASPSPGAPALLPPLSSAACGGDGQIIQALLAKGADPSLPHWCPPLLCAARTALGKPMRMLVQGGAACTAAAASAAVVAHARGELALHEVEHLVASPKFTGGVPCLRDLALLAAALRSPAAEPLAARAAAAAAAAESALRTSPALAPAGPPDDPLQRLPQHATLLLELVVAVDTLVTDQDRGCATAWTPEPRRAVLRAAADFAVAAPAAARSPLAPDWRPLWRRLYDRLSRLTTLLREEPTAVFALRPELRADVWRMCMSVDDAVAQLILCRCGAPARRRGMWARCFAPAGEVDSDAFAVALAAAHEADAGLGGLAALREVCDPYGCGKTTQYDAERFEQAFGAPQICLEAAATGALRGDVSPGCYAAESRSPGCWALRPAATLWDLLPRSPAPPEVAPARRKSSATAARRAAVAQYDPDSPEFGGDHEAARPKAALTVLVMNEAGALVQIPVTLEASSLAAACGRESAAGWRCWRAQGKSAGTLAELVPQLLPPCSRPCGAPPPQ